MVARLSILLSLAVATASCGSNSTCAIDSDCFAGEACVEQSCVPAVDIDPNNDGPNNGATNNGATNNGTNNNGTNNNGAGPACIVDPVGNSCDDDEFEPNEDTVLFPPELFGSQSWCGADGLTPTQTSGPLTLCAGDSRDLYRLLIDNRSPTDCITQQFTRKIEIRFSTPCRPENVDIKAYWTTHSVEDRCAEDENFRCEWSADGQTYTIQEVRQPEQLMDFRIAVAPADGRNDVQLDYEVVASIIQ